MKSGNLDTFFTDKATTRYLFGRSAAEAEISVAEGVMGYYDGLGGISEEASSSDVAAALNMPVVLVVNCRGMSISVVPVSYTHLAGSRADVPGDGIPIQIQLGHGETAHLALRHGRVAPLKLFVGDAASKSACVGRVFDDSHAEAVKGFLLQLRGSALGDTLLRVVEAFADVELHVFESIFFQFFT